jgi:hypothetical protein
MRFEEAHEGWNAGRLTQAEAARLLGMCERSFRRYLVRFEVKGLDGLIDRRLEQISNGRATACSVRSTATVAATTGIRRKPTAKSTRRASPSSVAPCGNWASR